MVNLESKIMSLKAAWIQRLLYNERSTSMLNMYLEKSVTGYGTEWKYSSRKHVH